MLQGLHPSQHTHPEVWRQDGIRSRALEAPTARGTRGRREGGTPTLPGNRNPQGTPKYIAPQTPQDRTDPQPEDTASPGPPGYPFPQGRSQCPGESPWCGPAPGAAAGGREGPPGTEPAPLPASPAHFLPGSRRDPHPPARCLLPACPRTSDAVGGGGEGTTTQNGTVTPASGAPCVPQFPCQALPEGFKALHRKGGDKRVQMRSGKPPAPLGRDGGSEHGESGAPTPNPAPQHEHGDPPRLRVTVGREAVGMGVPVEEEVSRVSCFGRGEGLSVPGGRRGDWGGGPSNGAGESGVPGVGGRGWGSRVGAEGSLSARVGRGAGEGGGVEGPRWNGG